jgi:cation diffusion facilitator CzcD-associated flavoprotein CzcO
MSSKTVAIIGAGPYGLAAAKHILDCGLTPFVFEKGNDIGGLWRPNTATWEGLHTNASIHVMTFADHPWPKEHSLFPSKDEVHAYIKISLQSHFICNK